MAFHRALQEAAAACGVKRLVWTSSTAVYDPTQSGTLVEADAGHHTSRHTGVDMLALEDVHRNGDVPFVAMRFGGLFGQGRHPVKALLKRGTVQGGDGHVQWVHEEDAAAACVFTALHEGPLPDAFNVVAPEVRTRRELLSAAFRPPSAWTSRQAGSKERCPPMHLTALGFSFQVQDPLTWVQSRGTVTDEGVWEGPHGPLNWTRHPARRTGKGCALMVHGYKGSDIGDCGGASPSAGRRKDGTCTAWISHTTAMSHPSQRTVWTKLRGVKTGTTTKQKQWPSRCKNWPSSTGNWWSWATVAGVGWPSWAPRQFQKAGGSLTGVACWAPVSDVFARFPWGPALKDWEASDRLEVLNGRTGQTLVHPYAFYLDAKARESELDIQSAIGIDVSCPGGSRHRRSRRERSRGAGHCLLGQAGHDGVHRRRQPRVWHGASVDDATRWPSAFEQAWEIQRRWLQNAVGG